MEKRNYAKRERKEYSFFIDFFQRLAISFVVIPCMRLFYKINIHGKENIPADESFIMAPTHTNYFDPLLAYHATRRPVAFMAKKELFEIWWLRPLIAALGAFSVNREKLEIATIKTAQMIIKTKSWILALFPQGSRDKAKRITKLTPGFAYFARVAQANVLPISITLKEHEREKLNFITRIQTIFDDTPIFSKFKNTYSTYEITIGTPIPYSKNLADTMEKWCESIVSIGGYEVDEKIREKIQNEREKEEKTNNESADSKS